MSASSIASLPRAAPMMVATPAWRFVLGWMIAWAAVGCAVAAGIVFASSIDFGPAFRLSILFAEVVGFTAFTSARLVFPLFVRLPYLLRVVLELLTVLCGTVFGSAAVLYSQPLFTLAQFRTVALIVLVNAAIAAIVGIALNTYDSMKRQIEQSYRVLREKEAFERDLEIAREVQRELLPRKVPRLAGLELAGICLPAVGVGGDYYDFLTVSDELIGLVIADVSGKGIPAALLMAGLQASVRTLCRPAPSAAQLNFNLNVILLETSSPSRYATFFLGFYNTRTHILNYSNAGHHPPLLLSATRVSRLEAGGLPLGMFPVMEYHEGNVQLEPGDLLALFTDGVVEAPRSDGEEFSERRLLAVLERERDRPLEEILDAVLAAVRYWCGDARGHDDVTLVLARVP